VLLAFAIRAAGAAATGLWYDELQSVTHAALPLVDLLRSVYRWDAHPPVYYVQLHVWMLAGTSDLWVRLNPIFWSTLTTASVYVIARRLYSRQVALLAATLFAASAFAVWYAQQARMYALLMFLGLWSLYFAHRFLTGNGGWLTAAAFLLTTELFLYSQGAAFLLLASLACYALVWRRGRRPARSMADEPHQVPGTSEVPGTWWAILRPVIAQLKLRVRLRVWYTRSIVLIPYLYSRRRRLPWTS
jgi:uncharacterized membrane protein